MAGRCSGIPGLSQEGFKGPADSVISGTVSGSTALTCGSGTFGNGTGNGTPETWYNLREMRNTRPRHGKHFAYMVQCVDGTYYTGSTNNLEARIEVHNAGNGAKYLRGKGPVRLVYAKAYRYYKRALNAEQWLKKRSRQEKAALIREYEKQKK